MVLEVSVRPGAESTPLERRTILVANSKGGSGKSTVATNIAAAYAQLGYVTSLVDTDPQLSSSRWLSMRPSGYPYISGVIGVPSDADADYDWNESVPVDAERVVLDSRGSMVGEELYQFIDSADDILIPVLPSAIDMQSTADFLMDVYGYVNSRGAGQRVMLVGNRLNKRNKFYYRLNRFMKRMGRQDIILLPDSYIFLRCSDEGLGVADLESYARYKQAINSVAKLIFTLEGTDASHID